MKKFIITFPNERQFILILLSKKKVTLKEITYLSTQIEKMKLLLYGCPVIVLTFTLQKKLKNNYLTFR